MLLPEKKFLLTLSYFFQYRNRGLSWFCYDQTSSLDFFTCFLNESILSNRFCLFFQSRFAIFYYSHYMGIQISIFFFQFSGCNSLILAGSSMDFNPRHPKWICCCCYLPTGLKILASIEVFVAATVLLAIIINMIIDFQEVNFLIFNLFFLLN